MKKEKLVVIKIGGHVTDDTHALTQFLKEFAAIRERKILVHGGGKSASDLAKKLNVPVIMHEGKRITNKETLDIAAMVYAGLINKTITALLQSMGCMAIGLSGADANCIQAEKRPATPIDYGFVGNLNEKSIHSDFINTLLQKDLVPVFCAITHDGKGNLLNTNADTIASMLAVSLGHLYEAQLVYCFEKEGVLKDVNDPETLIQKMNSTQYVTLKEEGIIHSGMIPKLDNAFSALHHGVSTVHLGKSNQLVHLINSEKHAGTLLYNS